MTTYAKNLEWAWPPGPPLATPMPDTDSEHCTHNLHVNTLILNLLCNILSIKYPLTVIMSTKIRKVSILYFYVKISL